MGKGIFLTPSNVLEQWCTVVVTILGLALYALIIGNAASILAKFDSTRQQHARQIAALHAFLKRKGISPASNLGQRLTQYFEFTLQGGRLQPDSAFISQLPNSLLSEVTLHENYSLIHKVNLFHGVSQVPTSRVQPWWSLGGALIGPSQPLPRRLAQGFVNSLVLRMKPEICLPGDYVFRAGEIGNSMYFVQQGTLHVVMALEGDDRLVNVLNAGSYFGAASPLDLAPTSPRPRPDLARPRSISSSSFEALLRSRQARSRCCSRAPARRACAPPRTAS